MAASSLDSVPPEEMEKLKQMDFKQFAYKPPSNHRIRNTKIQQQKEESKKKNKYSQRQMTHGCDELGTPTFKFHYIPAPVGTTPEPRKYALKYIPSSSAEPSQEMPGFFQTPPSIILAHTIMGLGNKTPKEDKPLDRKFSIVLINGLYKKDEMGNLTDEIDTYPVFSKFHADEWFVKNPFNRKSEEQRTLSYEINLFYKNLNNCINQAADFLLNGTDIITDCFDRYDPIDNKAKNNAGEWIAFMRAQRRNGNKSIPKLEPEDWKMSEPYINDVLPAAKISSIKSLMSLPTVYETRIERFRVVLINSFLVDLKRTVAGRGKNDEEQEQLAIEMADKFIEDNPDWEERLAIAKFERRVWQAPENLKTDLPEQEKVKKEINEKYARIVAEVKKKNPSLVDPKLQRKADESLAEVIISKKYQWVYNFPDLYDNRGRPVFDPTHEKAIDKYIKPHYGLSPGTLCSLNFLVNLSVPVSASTPYGLKLGFYGHIMFITGAVYNVQYSRKMNVFDFGDDISEYTKAFEENRQRIEEEKKRHNNMNGASSSNEQAKFVLGKEPLKTDFSEAALNNFKAENSDEKSNNNNDFKSDSDAEDDSEDDDDNDRKKESVYNDESGNSSDGESSSSSEKSRKHDRSNKNVKQQQPSSKRHKKH